jgi:hypothetical protein
VIRAHQHAAGARRDPDLREPSDTEAPPDPKEREKRGPSSKLGRPSGAVAVG